MKAHIGYFTNLLKKAFCLAGLMLLSHQVTMAASVGVNIEPTDFNPSVVSINVNDQVVWTWVSDFHNTESVTDLWDSPIENTGFVFTNVFTSAGSFPYFCVVHGFTGEVDVKAANVVTVAITSPTDGASFTAPAVVPITATATDSGGTITN